MRGKGLFLALLAVLLGAFGALATSKLGVPWGAESSPTAVERLKPEAPGKSWRVEGPLGREAAKLFAQGQFCYLPRTLGPR